MRTQYSVVKTSTGRFRIKATYTDGYSVFVGGARSIKYCYGAEESAQKMCDSLNAREAALEKLE